MAKLFPQLTDTLTQFIQEQVIFFVGTAAPTGTVNVSPKGMDSLRILTPNRLIWLNLTGSGNETAAQILQQNRMTIMFCSFGEKPLILRVYGTASIIHPSDENWQDLIAQFPNYSGARQIFDVSIEQVQTSCGFAVPKMDFVSDRDQLTKWATHKGEEGIQQYWKDRNTVSLDGFKTDLS